MEQVMNMYGPQEGPAVQKPQQPQQPQFDLAQVLQMLAQGREPGKQTLGHAGGTQRDIGGGVRDFNAPTGIAWLHANNRYEKAGNAAGQYSWNQPGSTQGQWNGPRDAQAFNRAQVPHAVVNNEGTTYTPFGDVGVHEPQYGEQVQPATFGQEKLSGEQFFNTYGLPHEGSGTASYRLGLSPEDRQFDGYKMPQAAQPAKFVGPNYFNALDNEEQIRSNTGGAPAPAMPVNPPPASNPMANVSPGATPKVNPSVPQANTSPPYVPGNNGQGGLELKQILDLLGKYGSKIMWDR